MRLTLDDLLNALQNPNTKEAKLANSKDTWARIGSKDSFAELGMESSELASFLQEWMSENPYVNIA